MGLVNPRDNFVGSSAWESSVQTLLPAKPHVHLCTPSPCLRPILTSQLLGDKDAPKLVPTHNWRASLSFSEYPSTPLSCPLSSLPSPEPNQTSQEMLEGIFCLSVLGFPGARETSYISSDLNHQRRATASSHPSTTPISLE